MILSSTLTILSAVAALVWLTRHFMVSRERKKNDVLSPNSLGLEGPVPHISVFVAAKDEEENIEACVRTMLSQDYPSFDMTVCNDRSVDRTGDIVRSVAAEDSRLHLANIDHLPKGWCGKCHAMSNGIAANAASEWIAMTDADCKQISPRTLSVAMRRALDSGADLLSVLPELEMNGWWENIIQPVCSGVMMIWYLPDKVNNPAKPNAYANGAFILMKRSAYEAVGKHEAVKDKLMEDMHLAARIKQAGMKLRVIQSTGLYSVRMYTSLKQILRGWSRIFFGTFGTFPKLAISLAIMLVMGLLPYLTAALGFSLGLAGGEHAAAFLAAGIVALAAVVLQLSVIYRFYCLAGARRDLFWTYPIGCIVVVVTLLMAMTKHRRGAKVVWRNTAYAKPGNS
jgi:cellulose synthase/poly-beta-1,6-N-acetylglucosamine synthase-like glycosyltransferase